ncbi:transposase [Novosphingobium resinovorum]|uniref:transposase n=1 Tax=Novosphingobium resinovorum TaxID=158500 RepID=UPI0036080D7A
MEDPHIGALAAAKGILRWHGDEEAQKAVYANRARLKSRIGRKTMRKRGELVERSFAHVLDRGGMRRAWLRGRENLHKRYLIHVAGFNLGILMRALFGCGTPRGGRQRFTGVFARCSDRKRADLRPRRPSRSRNRCPAYHHVCGAGLSAVPKNRLRQRAVT